MANLFDRPPDDDPTPDLSASDGQPRTTADIRPQPAPGVPLPYLAPHLWGEPNAAAWNEYLDYRCRWSPADFGGGYAWDAAIPDRADWGREVERLNVHLRNLEREGETDDHEGYQTR